MSVLAKAADVIDVLNGSTEPVRLGAIAASAGIPKSSAHRLLAELVDLGLARRVEDGSYTVGYRLIRWGHAAERSLNIRAAVEPIMRRLSDAVAESVQFYVPEGNHRICVATIDGPQTLRPVMQPGKILPLGAGASGKLLLAYASEHTAVEAKAAADEKLLARWPSDALLAEIRERGCAISTAEMEDGLTAMSAAVLTQDGQLLGALGIAGATLRLPPERCAQLANELVRSAREIALALGA